MTIGIPVRTVKGSLTRRVSVIAVAVSLLAVLVAGCGSEAKVDPQAFTVAPDLSPRFGPADSTDRKADADPGSLLYEHSYEGDGEFFTMLLEGSVDDTEFSSDWDLASAQRAVENFTDAPATITSTVNAEDMPAEAQAYTSNADIGDGTTVQVFGQAWERGRCAVIVMTNVPVDEVAELISKVDQRVIEACGT
jgi:hypothetical protein